MGKRKKNAKMEERKEGGKKERKNERKENSNALCTNRRVQFFPSVCSFSNLLSLAFFFSLSQPL
jgi:hypothetical protein